MTIHWRLLTRHDSQHYRHSCNAQLGSQLVVVSNKDRRTALLLCVSQFNNLTVPETKTIEKGLKNCVGCFICFFICGFSVCSAALLCHFQRPIKYPLIRNDINATRITATQFLMSTNNAALSHTHTHTQMLTCRRHVLCCTLLLYAALC